MPFRGADNPPPLYGLVLAGGRSRMGRDLLIDSGDNQGPLGAIASAWVHSPVPDQQSASL